MTLGDLYCYASQPQQFVVLAEGECDTTKALYKGELDDCPSDLLEQVVCSFRATDWNCLLVELCI